MKPMTDDSDLPVEDLDTAYNGTYIETADDDFEPLEFVTTSEPILVALLRESLGGHHSDNVVMRDFAQIVLPALIPLLTAIPAKGGDFAAAKAESGADTSNYGRDQSLHAHIVNGLFAVLRIVDVADQFGSRVTQDLGDYGRRLIIATYALHDYNKMPATKAEMGTGLINPSAANIDQIYAVVDQQTQNLYLPQFFAAGGHTLNLSDLVYTIHNTQVKSGTLSVRLLKDRLSDAKLINQIAGFSRIADLLAYGTFLELDTLDHKINPLLVETLGNPPFRLTAHRVTQVTGIVTAYLHNAVVQSMVDAGHVPILFAPNGVIYASPNGATIPELSAIAEMAVAQTQNAARDGIEASASSGQPVGIAWGTQGVKTAPFIEALYTSDQVLRLIWRHLQRHLVGLPPRKREQLKVSKKLNKGRDEGWPGFESDAIALLVRHMDERAEALGDWLSYAYALDTRKDSNAVELILTALGFEYKHQEPLIQVAQNGGVQFWPYLLALRFIAANATMSPEAVVDRINELVSGPLAERFGDMAYEPLTEHIRQHAMEVVLLPDQPHVVRERFGNEMKMYALGKTDNKRGVYDTIYNIPYGVEQQQEATLPYMPTPYSQRLPLGSSDGLGAWRRGLSGVGVVNMLLMQTALRQPFQFEERKGKMLFLYPVYYFTPETGDALLGLTKRLSQFDLNAWLKHTRQGQQVDAETVSGYHAVTDRPATWRPPVETMRYPTILAPTLVQVAVDPGKDATDAVSWINAVFMALILASLVDVKIVVTDSPVPLYTSGTDFDETVLLDAPHAVFSDLIGRVINLDHLLSALQRLTVAVAVTRDSFGFDKLDQIVKIARDLSDEAAAVFRGYQRIGEDRAKSDSSVTAADANRYLMYVRILEDTHPLKKRSALMNHARALVEGYYRFYRAKGYKTNAILRPLQAAADIVAESSPANSDPEMLIDAITGRLIQIDNAIMSGDTEGYTPRNSTIPERQAAMRDFASYFVQNYFTDALKGRKTELRGKQFNILRLACDAVYRSINAADRAAFQSETELTSTESESN